LVGDRGLPVRVGCCTLSELVRKEGGDRGVIGGWEVKRFVDGAHLKDGALRDWGFEDIEIAHGKVMMRQGRS
jgi:transcription factor C subunit 7